MKASRDLVSISWYTEVLTWIQECLPLVWADWRRERHPWTALGSAGILCNTYMYTKSGPFEKTPHTAGIQVRFPTRLKRGSFSKQFLGSPNLTSFLKGRGGSKNGKFF